MLEDDNDYGHGGQKIFRDYGYSGVGWIGLIDQDNEGRRMTSRVRSAGVG